MLTATQAGKVLVYATKAGDDRYQEAKANPVEVTIHQAQLTIRAHNKTASVGDRVPALSSYDYTISGLIGQDTLAKAPALAYGVAPRYVPGGDLPHSDLRGGGAGGGKLPARHCLCVGDADRQ